LNFVSGIDFNDLVLIEPLKYHSRSANFVLFWQYDQFTFCQGRGTLCKVKVSCILFGIVSILWIQKWIAFTFFQGVAKTGLLGGLNTGLLVSGLDTKMF